MAKLTPVVNENNQITGYLFECPGCGMSHYPAVRPHTLANGASWEFNGDLEKPTFSPSILSRFPQDGKEVVCHCFVERGQIRYLNDCTHALAGQTVELEDVETN